jgi:pimeloyl-ACP methyl ester carboxylesterase
MNESPHLSLHWEERGPRGGARPPVVLLHPTPVDHRFWLPAAAGFAPEYRVIAPDLPGHGRSPLPEGPLGMAEMGAAILGLLDALDVARAIFCGCSIGGYLLYELWRQAPERVHALAFCCAKPHPDSEEARQGREAVIESVREQGTAPFFRRTVESLVGAPARQRDPDMERRLLAMMEPMSAAAVVAVQRARAARPDSRPTAASIRVPTAVLAAQLDRGSTPAEMRELAGLVPGSRFYLLQEMGHYAPYEQPHLVGALLRGFVDEVA